MNSGCAQQRRRPPQSAPPSVVPSCPCFLERAGGHVASWQGGHGVRPRTESPRQDNNRWASASMRRACRSRWCMLSANYMHHFAFDYMHHEHLPPREPRNKMLPMKFERTCRHTLRKLLAQAEHFAVWTFHHSWSKEQLNWWKRTRSSSQNSRARVFAVPQNVRCSS